MTNRELLEFAAKAAGIELKGWTHISGNEEAVIGYDAYAVETWGPLTDDGDEARLEGAMCFNVSWGMASVTVDSSTERYNDHGGDKQKARRRAGVIAAAAIGKDLP